MLFNAISYVWNEEDIIESSVLNALCQGCDNVFIIDNGSTDSTIKNAIKSGAKLVYSKKTKYFDEREKICQLNSFVKYYNSLNLDDEIWWMYFDADEFMSTHNELSIRNLIIQLDKNIKAIKGFFYDHIPSYPPYNVEGRHPIDFMPDCNVSSVYKIPIIKYNIGEDHIFSAGGAHEIDTNCNEFLICENAIAIHHFQYRQPDATLKRLKTLLRRLYWMDKRSEIIYKSRKSMYHSRYENVKKTYKDNLYSIFKTRYLPYNYNNIIRWYNLYDGKQFDNINKYDAVLCKAFYYYFMKEYDISLCRFNDLLEISKYSSLRNWITLKLAECFSFSDPEAANQLFQSLSKLKNNEIDIYIARNDKNNAELNKNYIKIERYMSKFAIDKNVLCSRMDEILNETNRYADVKI